MAISTTDFFWELEREASTTSGLLKIATLYDFDPQSFVSGLVDTSLEIIPTNEGPVSVVVEQGHPTDCSKQTTQFDFHKDGLYHDRLPDLVALYCQNPGRGDTPTKFSDTTLACRELVASGAMDILRQCEIVYIGKDGRHFPSALVTSHPFTGEPTLNVAARGYVRPIFACNIIPSVREINLAVNQMFEAIDKTIVHSQSWSRGQIVVCDNHRYVHGRDAHSPDNDRVLLRIWLSLRAKKIPDLGFYQDASRQETSARV